MTDMAGGAAMVRVLAKLLWFEGGGCLGNEQSAKEKQQERALGAVSQHLPAL